MFVSWYMCMCPEKARPCHVWPMATELFRIFVWTSLPATCMKRPSGTLDHHRGLHERGIRGCGPLLLYLFIVYHPFNHLPRLTIYFSCLLNTRSQPHGEGPVRACPGRPSWQSPMHCDSSHLVPEGEFEILERKDQAWTGPTSLTLCFFTILSRYIDIYILTK